jgi:leucyl aminopeptidase (aminopeptidase T)
MDFAAYEKMLLEAINADYAAVSKRGEKLREMLKAAKQIRVTSPAGTDFTFSPAPGRDVYVDDGIVTEEKAKSKLFAQKVAALPGGNVFLAPLETSANGRVAVPKMRCRLNPMNDVGFEFKNGSMQNFKAATNGECFQETMQPYNGPKDMFGAIWFGLNPSLRVVEDGKANFRPFNAAGMVYVGVGDNRVYGGANNADTGYSFPITNATVTIDGKTVIKDGKLIF